VGRSLAITATEAQGPADRIAVPGVWRFCKHQSSSHPAGGRTAGTTGHVELPVDDVDRQLDRRVVQTLLLDAFRSSLPVDAEVAPPSGQRQRRGACWAGTGDAIGKRLRARTVGVDAAPELIPKRNSEPIVNRGRIATTRRVSRLARSTSLMDAVPTLRSCSRGYSPLERRGVNVPGDG